MKEVDERLLPPYRDAVNEGVGAIMVSFNSLTGTAMVLTIQNSVVPNDKYSSIG